MPQPKRLPPRAGPSIGKAAATIAVSLLAWSIASAAFTIWLLQYNPLIPLIGGALLFFGGALMLPERTINRHVASIGFVIGFAAGSWWFLAQ